jgi:hypothetical protein
LTGHKTRSIFDLYDIVDEKDLSKGVERLTNYHRQQTLPPPVDGGVVAEEVKEEPKVAVGGNVIAFTKRK